MNHQNGKQIRLLVDGKHPDIDHALAIVKMALRNVRLKHKITLPLAIFKTKVVKCV